MNNFIKIVRILIVINLLSACQYIKDFKDQSLENINDNNKNSQIKSKENLEIRISCGQGNIEDFLGKGWKIKSKYSEEKICSWKSVPANKKCNMERDKGCKITKPDVIGKEIFYLLEK
tara:strand:+ start:2690 stop:3043 length:354 start_codon:yes stop_codon:yes gene_type:complete